MAALPSIGMRAAFRATDYLTACYRAATGYRVVSNEYRPAAANAAETGTRNNRIMIDYVKHVEIVVTNPHPLRVESLPRRVWCVWRSAPDAAQTPDRATTPGTYLHQQHLYQAGAQAAAHRTLSTRTARRTRAAVAVVGVTLPPRHISAASGDCSPHLAALPSCTRRAAAAVPYRPAAGAAPAPPSAGAVSRAARERIGSRRWRSTRKPSPRGPTPLCRGSGR